MDEDEALSSAGLTRAVYAAVVLLGAANLLPWMAFLTMADYFDQTYRSNAMEYYFPTVSTFVLVITSTLVLAYGNRFSFDARILLPSVIMSILVLAVPLVDLLLSSKIIDPNLGFVITLASVFFNAFCSSVAQNSLYGLAGVLGDGATQALQTGTGMMGVISVMLRAITKWVPNLSSSGSMWIFCLSGSAILLISSVGYMYMVRDPTISSRLAAIEVRRLASNLVENGSVREAILPASDKVEQGISHSDMKPSLRASPVLHAISSLRKVCLECVSVFLVFVVCLACFPGLSTSFVSLDWNLGTWFPLLMVAMYNIGDLIGKASPSSIRLIDARTLPIWVVAHFFFLPFFLILSFYRERLPTFLQTDLVPTLSVFTLGVSTGYIGCMCLILTSEHNGSPEQKESWGMASSFSLMLGLTVGSASSLAGTALATSH